MIYVSWGTKSYEKAVGVAADFCPICRRASVVEVRQLRSQGHLYGVGLGQGEHVGNLCKCLTCGTNWAIQAGTIQTSVDASAQLSLDDLIKETFPRFHLLYGERLEQEAAIKRDPFAFDAQTRGHFIAEPFIVLNNELLSEDVKPGWFGGFTGLGVIVSLGFGVAAFVAFSSGDILAGLGWAVVCGVLGWLTLRSVTLTTGQLMRKRVYPRLAVCLAPLLPSSDEMAHVLTQIRAQNNCARDTHLPALYPLILKAGASIETAHAQAAAQAR